MSAPFYQNTTMRLINKRLTPLTIGNLTRLASLLLNLYELSGNIPSILANCQTLNVLSLESNKLTGGIPKEIFSISTLSINLGLAHNLLTGSIPSEVGTMRNLAKIDVRMNKLSGKIPSSLGECQELEQIYLGGNFFHGSIPSSLRAPKGDNLVGVGSFGSVYKGRLDDNSTSVVAVKVLNLHQRGASKSFMRECEALRNIRHRNLVMILTACSSVDFRGNEFKAMVFEFMANGSLDHWLHSAPNEQGETKELTLIERINIATDIAYALDYLHHLSKLDILPSC